MDTCYMMLLYSIGVPVVCAALSFMSLMYILQSKELREAQTQLEQFQKHKGHISEPN